MVTAYVMVKAHTGDADRLREEIEHIDGVEEAHIVAGDVDLIAKVSVDTPAAVKDVAATHVQDIEGVESTQTYIAMD
ncbi:Lrp/AsnC family transcriptional regulator [Haloarcula laminariae]|uniref:Lrp/AsnC family transcriptional regulator n=1 Tax=Haloarcula laminariae TaxID=2961577 RepID=UPI0021CA9EB1|nr:Lrp/AsnC ligand binding domain-containing protein [Halomicroarcula laminariae]